MILVDTNAWVSHLRAADRALQALLEQNRVVTCDVVIGELLLGTGIRNDVHQALMQLPMVPCPTAVETRAFVERHHRVFRGSGVGWADAQIILAASSTGALVHSSDRAVRRVWRALGFRLP